MEYRLVVVVGGSNETYTLKEGVNTIGRDSDNDIQLLNPNISRHHARILITTGGVVEIEDLNSVNGTYVNGKKITKMQLSHGNEIKMGKLYILFEETSGEGMDVSSQTHDYSTRVRNETIKTGLNSSTSERIGGENNRPLKPIRPLKPLAPKQEK